MKKTTIQQKKIIPALGIIEKFTSMLKALIPDGYGLGSVKLGLNAFGKCQCFIILFLIVTCFHESYILGGDFLSLHCLKAYHREKKSFSFVFINCGEIFKLL